MHDRSNPKLAHIRYAARTIGVTETWLRQECEAGHLPHLRAGRSILVDLDLIRRTLLERAQQIPDEQGRQHCEHVKYQSRQAFGIDPDGFNEDAQ